MELIFKSLRAVLSSAVCRIVGSNIILVLLLESAAMADNVPSDFPSGSEAIHWLSCPPTPPIVINSGTWVYVTIGQTLIVIDGKSLDSPRVVRYTPLPAPASSLAVEGNTLFTTDSEQLYMYDISDASWPRFIGSFHPAAVSPPIAGTTVIEQLLGVHDKRVWLFLRRSNQLGDPPFGQIQTIDVTDPNRPQTVFAGLVGSAQPRSWIDRAYFSYPHLMLQNRHYYIGSSSTDLKIYQVSDVEKPAPIGTYTVSLLADVGFSLQFEPGLIYEAGDIWPAGSRVFVGLAVVDISDPKSPRLRGRVERSVDQLPRLLATRDKLVLGIVGRTMIAFDVRDPDLPRARGHIELAFEPRATAVGATRAYLIEEIPGSYRLHVVSTSDLDQPRIASSLPLWCLRPQLFMPNATP